MCKVVEKPSEHTASGTVAYYMARHYGRFLHLVAYVHGVYAFCADTSTQIYMVPRRVLRRWVASGRALLIAGDRRAAFFARLAPKSMAVQNSVPPGLLLLPHLIPPKMKMLNTVNDHAKGCIKTPLLQPADYKEFVGITYARFEYLRTHPAALPTREEVLLLSSWFRCAIEDLYRPANSNLQKAMDAVAVASQRTMIGRALRQAAPTNLLLSREALRPNRFRS